MTINGLEGNGYLINNPIIVEVTGINILKLEVNILNQGNGRSTTIKNLYPNPSSQKITFSIDNVIKGLFTEPNHNENYFSFGSVLMPNNSNQFILTFKLLLIGSEFSQSQTLTKIFVRGGRITDQTNQTLPANSIISPTPVIPVFSGFPYAFYETNSNFRILKTNPVGVKPINVEYIRQKSCDGKYIAFLNSLGGYSYWLFDNFEDEVSTSNLGIVNNGFNQKDLGNNFDSSFKVFGKIPERFYPLMRDLISSPEILLWQPENQTWKRIYNNGNKWVSNSAKVAYKVDYKFSDFTNYNPAL